jgi:hypothetical protein
MRTCVVEFSSNASNLELIVLLRGSTSLCLVVSRGFPFTDPSMTARTTNSKLLLIKHSVPGKLALPQTDVS